MYLVLIVGDEPVSKCGTPFKDAKCWPRLESWIKQLSISDYLLCNRTDEDFSDVARFHFGPIIALGTQASLALTKLEIPFYKLPHPSGLNRLLNDKQFVDNKLKDCKHYIKHWPRE